MNFSYAMFMAECENAFPQERSKAINDCICDFIALKAQGKNPNNYINTILTSHHLKSYNLTRNEINYINSAVNNFNERVV